MAIKVLVVDDSAFMRQVLTRMLEEDREHGIEVVAIARDGADALAKIAAFKPDVVTLDVDMPNMDGLECLAKIMSDSPLPVIMVSSFTIAGAEPTLKALELGAIDYITKPSVSVPELLNTIKEDLIKKVLTASAIKPTKLKTINDQTSVKPQPASTSEIVNLTSLELLAIGSSTGGPRALYYLLPLLPKNFPLGVVIAQHMPKEFTKVFAQRLDTLCQVEVREAVDGDQIKPGLVLIAPAGKQTAVVRNGNGLKVVITEEPVLLFKPSVDYLFDSIAKCCKDKVIGLIMTGMGSDGAIGMKKMRDAGARTIAESEDSCVVFGMPRVAIEMGGAEFVESLPLIFPKIEAILTQKA